MDRRLLLRCLGSSLASVFAVATAHAAPALCQDAFPALDVTASARPLSQAPPVQAPVAELSARSKPHAKVDSRVLGATTATRASSFLYRYRVIALDNGQVCVQPRIDITLAYRPLQVEVASELSGNTCLREVVLQHEQAHVEAYRTHLGRAAMSLAESLPARLGDAVFLADNVVAAKAAIDMALDTRVEAAIQEELDKAEALHAGIDTAEESERMYHVCGGALYSLWSTAARR